LFVTLVDPAGGLAILGCDEHGEAVQEAQDCHGATHYDFSFKQFAVDHRRFGHVTDLAVTIEPKQEHNKARYSF
jgi:hypothetical protein